MNSSEKLEASLCIWLFYTRKQYLILNSICWPLGPCQNVATCKMLPLCSFRCTLYVLSAGRLLYNSSSSGMLWSNLFEAEPECSISRPWGCQIEVIMPWGRQTQSFALFGWVPQISEALPPVFSLELYRCLSTVWQFYSSGHIGRLSFVSGAAVFHLLT